MKRGTPLKRGRPLQRKTRLKQRRSSPRRSSRTRDPARLAWTRRQPCCAKVHGGRCRGRVEADHAGRRGFTQKADDDTGIAICAQHHRWRTDFSGPFRDWSQAQMREWLELEITRHRHEYSQHLIRERKHG